MTLLVRIAALALLTSGLVAALGLAVLNAIVDHRVPRGEYVIPGLILACVGGIIGAIAGTAREIVAARGAAQPQTTELSTATKRRTPRVAAVLAFCFLCVVVVWFKARSLANDEPPASKAPVPPSVDQPTVKPGTASVDSAKATPAKSDAVADSKMPDISGKWRIPVDDRAAREIVLSRVQSDSADFEYVGQVETVRVKWSADARQFDGTISTTSPETVSKITLQPSSDQNSLRVAVKLSEQVKEQMRKSQPNGTPVDILIQSWTRVEPVPKPPVTNAPQDTAALKVFALKNASAVECTTRLKDLKFKARITADTRTNSIHVAGKDDELKVIEAILLRLDDASDKSPKQTAETDAGLPSITSPLNSPETPVNSLPLPHPVPHSDQPPEAYNFGRMFEVRKSAEAAAKHVERKTTGCIGALPDSPAIGFTKVGDSVDLLLPDVERFVVLEAGQKYVTPMRVVAKGVPVEKLVDYGGDVRFTVRLTPIENNLLDRLPTDDVLREMTITHVVRLKHAAAEQVVALIREAFPFGKRDSEFEQQVPLVSCEADLKQNAVVLKGQMVWSWQPLALLEVEAAIQKLDHPAPGTAARVQRASALPNTPAAKQLVEQLAAQESAAAAEAATIRQLQANGQAEQNRQAIAEHQRKLKNLLSTAFDLKLQLEELQVQELQSRLSRLERQIGQRKELREKIINRRAGELIEGDALKWDSTGDKAKPHGVTATKLKDASQDSQNNDPSVMSTRFRFVGAGGMGLVLENHDDGTLRVRAPGNLSFPRDARETNRKHLRFHDEWREEGRRFVGLLDIQPVTPVADEFLRHNRIPLTVGNGDVLEVSKGKVITKVIYLAKPKAGEATRTVESLVSWFIDPDTDPIEEANRRGEILAVLRLAANDELLGLPAAKTSDAVSDARTSKSDPLPSPAQLREQLEPFAKRAAAAEERVRELEPIYFRDRSNAAELQRAFEEMTAARSECRSRLRKSIPVAINRLNPELASAKALVEALSAQHREKLKSLSEGKSTEAEVKAVSDSWKQAIEATAAIEAKLESYGNLAMQLTPFAGRLEEMDDPLAFQDPPVAPQPGNHPDVSLAWLEAVTNLKLEFVQFDDLKLPFKASLRIREANNELGLKAGDLIVALYGQRFDSLDQAVVALRPSTLSHDAFGNHLPNTVLSGGLGGRQKHLPFSYKSWRIDPLLPTTVNRAIVRLEVRVRGAKPEEIETGYVTGTCVSPDGLVVIPFAVKSLAETDPAVPFGKVTGTVRIVASDEERGLTLLKLESPDHQLFGWIKCRAGVPSKGQRLLLRDDRDDENFSSHETKVTEIGQAYPQSRNGADGFVVTVHRNVGVPLGAPLVSVDHELQGIVIESKPFAAASGDGAESDKKDSQRSFAIPAIHVQKLIDEYRRSTAKQKPDGSPLSKSPNERTSLNAEEAAALVFEKLGVKFGSPVDAKGVGPKFRGGVMIADVTANGVVAKAGFRKGDILVGLGRHETLSLENVVFVLRNPEVPKGITTQSLRAYILRNGETLTGDLVLSVPMQTSATTTTVEQLIAVLQDDRQGDRDPVQFVAALQQLRTIDLGDKAPRVASAILAAIAFHELLVKDPSKTGNSSPVPISFYGSSD